MTVPEAPERVLISGATRGIGEALCRSLSQSGARIANLSRSGAAVDGCALSLACDVTDATGVQAAVARASEELGGFDLVIANAGVLAATGPTWEISPKTWWREFEVNVGGVFNLVQAVLPGLIEQGSGRLILVSSGMGAKPSPFASAYGASKAAVTSLAGSLAGELAGTGVSVFAISPGMVKTEMTDWPAPLRLHRPDLDAVVDSDFTPISAVQRLVGQLAGGRYDALSGRFLHVRDDLDELLQRPV